MKYEKIQWVIQKNLSSEDVIREMEAACHHTGVTCYTFDIVPFSERLPDFPKDKRSIFYGSTTTMYLAYKDGKLKEGLFFDEKAFSMENYLARWGEHMLNFGAQVITVGQLNSLDYEPDKLLFIRPNEDSKSFSGTVRPFNELADWFEGIKTSEDMSLTTDTKIIVGEPYHIETEWRLWIVLGKVVAASKYREHFNLKKETGCPPEVIDFAESRCETYVPHDVFVMDIGLCGGTLYIIECGCMNSAGFYAADIDKIVGAVTAYSNDIFFRSGTTEPSLRIPDA